MDCTDDDEAGDDTCITEGNSLVVDNVKSCKKNYLSTFINILAYKYNIIV